MVLRSVFRLARCSRATTATATSTKFSLRPFSSLHAPSPLASPHHAAVAPKQWRHGPRTLTTSSPPPPPTTLTDPARPALFYHLLDPPNPLSSHFPAYAVSFLAHPPGDARGSEVLGWLPAMVSDAPEDSSDSEAGLGDFTENPSFTSVLHKVIKDSIAEGSDDVLNAEAMQRWQGWMHINDGRNVPAQGRINTPDDIIASVMVEGGKMCPETYNPMPTYRICTTDGLTTLSEQMHARLVQELMRREQSE